MRNDDGAAREVKEGLFERPQGLNVKVIGRFVQEENVTATFKKFREMDPVALTP